MNSSRLPPCPGVCAIWLLVAITVLVLLAARNIHRTLPLLDYPSERSHPQWKSSLNLCLKLNRTTVIRA